MDDPSGNWIIVTALYDTQTNISLQPREKQLVADASPDVLTPLWTSALFSSTYRPCSTFIAAYVTLKSQTYKIYFHHGA